MFLNSRNLTRFLDSRNLVRYLESRNLRRFLESRNLDRFLESRNLPMYLESRNLSKFLESRNLHKFLESRKHSIRGTYYRQLHLIPNWSFFHALVVMLLTKFVLNKTKKVHFLHHCRKLAQFFVRLHLPFVCLLKVNPSLLKEN